MPSTLVVFFVNCAAFKLTATVMSKHSEPVHHRMSISVEQYEILLCSSIILFLFHPVTDN